MSERLGHRLITEPGYPARMTLKVAKELAFYREAETFVKAAGGDVEVAVVPRSVEAMMLSYERSAAHYEVVDTVSAPREGGA